MARTTTKNQDEPTEVDILRLTQQHITFNLLGTTPLLLNRMSEKVKRQLLYPSPKKNAAERETTLKHEPLEEYRASPYRNRDPKAPTLFHLPSGMFKRALANAALDIPGAFKAQIGRLCSITSTQINLYGKPCLKSDVVRTAGKDKTPDIRFRACLPEWACQVTVRFMIPLIKPSSVVNLMAAAGVTIAIGDNRVEKGANDFGQFDLVDSDDEAWNRIVKEQGRKVQQLGMDSPEYYDLETQDLVEWFYLEHQRRRSMPTTTTTKKRSKKNGGLTLPAEELPDETAHQ